eukprot:6474071-Amphidinium_carterae.1
MSNVVKAIAAAPAAHAIRLPLQKRTPLQASGLPLTCLCSEGLPTCSALICSLDEVSSLPLVLVVRHSRVCALGEKEVMQSERFLAECFPSATRIELSFILIPLEYACLVSAYIPLTSELSSSGVWVNMEAARKASKFECKTETARRNEPLEPLGRRESIGMCPATVSRTPKLKPEAYLVLYPCAARECLFLVLSHVQSVHAGPRDRGVPWVTQGSKNSENSGAMQPKRLREQGA